MGRVAKAIEQDEHGVRVTVEDTGWPYKVARDTCDGGREAYASKLILVRPDQDVVWLGNDAPGDERGLLRKVVGRA
jgi:hypothetical protein